MVGSFLVTLVAQRHTEIETLMVVKMVVAAMEDWHLSGTFEMTVEAGAQVVVQAKAVTAAATTMTMTMRILTSGEAREDITHVDAGALGTEVMARTMSGEPALSRYPPSR